MLARSTAFGCAALIVIALAAGAAAQNGAPASPTGQNPVARSVTEQQILGEFGRARGNVSVPDLKESMLEQPQGRRYQSFHERWLPWIGGVLVLGIIMALGAFFLWNGPVRLNRRPTGIKIRRFNVLERFVHWITAVSFIILAITGLNYVLGDPVSAGRRRRILDLESLGEILA